MNKALKVAGWIVVGLLALVAVGYLLLLAINWNDQPASAAARRLEQVFAAGAPPVPEADNGFVYWIGFGAQQQVDPMLLGAQRIGWSHQMAKTVDAVLPASFPGTDMTFAKPAAAMADIERECRWAEPACVAALAGKDTVIDAALAADALLLARYQTLLSKPGWQATMPVDGRLPFPNLAAPVKGQGLLMLRAWREAGKGNAGEVARMLAADGVFWRRVAASPNSLIFKMVATAALRRHFAWGNLILRRLPPERAYAAVPEHWHRALSLPEHSMLHAYAYEYKYLGSSVDTLYLQAGMTEDGYLDEVMGSLLAPLFKVQDFKNMYAQRLSAESDTLNVPYPQFAAALQRTRADNKAMLASAGELHAYNLAGRILIAIGDVDFTKYAARVADLEGVRRAALLTVELRKQQLSAAQLPQALADASLRDPYHSVPFGWDGAAASIVFTGLEALPRGRHAFLY